MKQSKNSVYSGFGAFSNNIISGFKPNATVRSKTSGKNSMSNTEYKFKMRKRPKKGLYENKVLGFIHQELRKIPEIKYMIGDWIVSLETRFKKVFFERDILKCVNCKILNI